MRKPERRSRERHERADPLALARPALRDGMRLRSGGSRAAGDDGLLVVEGEAIDPYDAQCQGEILRGTSKGHVICDEQQRTTTLDPSLHRGDFIRRECGGRWQLPIVVGVSWIEWIGDDEYVRRREQRV